jgi:phage antirepressor YoqD-like protein
VAGLVHQREDVERDVLAVLLAERGQKLGVDRPGPFREVHDRVDVGGHFGRGLRPVGMTRLVILHDLLGFGVPLERARLVENRDYLVVPQKGEQQFQGVKDRIDYFLTLEAGKHFAMMSNTDKGFEVREYFIECERRAKSASVALNPANMSRLQLLEMAMQAEQERLSLEAKVEEMLPDVRAFERIGKTDGLLNVTEAAKALSMQPKALFRWLQAHEWIYRRAGGKNWLGYQRRVQTGLLDHKVTPVERGDGSEKMVEQVMITGKGLSRLAKDLDRDTQSHLPV